MTFTAFYGINDFLDHLFVQAQLDYLSNQLCILTVPGCCTIDDIRRQPYNPIKHTADRNIQVLPHRRADHLCHGEKVHLVPSRVISNAAWHKDSARFEDSVYACHHVKDRVIQFLHFRLDGSWWVWELHYEALHRLLWAYLLLQA